MYNTRDFGEKRQIFFFTLSQIGLFLSLSGTALGYRLITSIGVWIIFAAIAAISFFELFHEQHNKKYLFAIIAIGVFSGLSMVLSHNISYDSFVKLLSFLEIPLIVAFTRPINSDKRIKTSCYFAVLMFIVYVYIYFSPRAYHFKTTYGVTYLDDLTLGFSNPNETGMHLFACLVVLVSCIFYVTKKRHRIFLLIVSVVIIGFTIQTLSRASILVSTLFIILSVYHLFKGKNASKILQKICFYSPIFVLLFSLIFSKYIPYLYFMRETLDTGRISIYYEQLNSMNLFNWIFGDYFNSFQNNLNAYFSIVLTIGTISLLFFLFVFDGFVKMCDIYSKSKYNIIAFLGLLMIVVHSSVESAILVSGSFYAASFYSIYVIAIDKRNVFTTKK